MDRIARRGLILAGVLLVAGCGQTPDMFTVRLVDPRDSQVWPQPLQLVEVRRAPLAPLPGFERVWRWMHPGRVDTIPGIRTFWPITMMGENVVIGFHGEDRGALTVFQYDALSRRLTRSALPPWLSRAVLNPLPAFAPGGRHVIFLARQPGDQMRVEVHSWPDGAPVVLGLPFRPNREASRPAHISWWNAREFVADVPALSDTGPVWLLIKGRTDGPVRIDSAMRFADVKPPPPIPMRGPAEFPDLPRSFRAEMVSRGCTVPQSDSGPNVIRGHFGSGRQVDWAVLCSQRGQSMIFVYWGGPAQCPREIQRAPDGQYSAVYSTYTVFLRSIYVTDGYEVQGPRGRPGTDERVTLAHDAIEDSKHNGGSTVWFCEAGKWVQHTGAYRR
jgi:hypothetical protein